MSERERWIVYPLLFLAIGASLKDKFFPSRIEAESIECNKIMCKGEIRCDAILANRTTTANTLTQNLQSTNVTVIDKEGTPKVVMRAVPAQPGQSTAAKTIGQINVLDEANLPMNVIGRNLLCTRLVATGPVDIFGSRLRVYDGRGRLRSQIRTTEVEAEPNDDENGNDKPNLTAGRLDLIGPHGTGLVSLGHMVDGGFVAASHDQRRAHVLLSHRSDGSGLLFLGGDNEMQSLNMVPTDVVEAQPLFPHAASPDAARPEEEQINNGDGNDSQPEEGKNPTDDNS